MSAIALSSFLVGLLLADRFKVLVLLPAIAIAVASAAGMALLANASPESFLMAALLLGSGFQVGYLVGMCRPPSGDGRTRPVPAYGNDRR